MTAEVAKYTLEQIEALELAPGAEHEKLEGWVPELAGEEDLRQALEKAFDYRGDVSHHAQKRRKNRSLHLQSPHRRDASPNPMSSTSRPRLAEKRKVSYAEIARLEFSGKDRAAGKHWEDWVKAYNDRKAAGEKNIALHPDALE